MASPRSERFANTPVSRVLQGPLSDEAIWKRLKEAGFDEESIKRRDKAALIAYIAKLEAEIFDHQHHMGLLILEKKDLLSKFEQIKASAEAAELKYKLDQAAHVSSLAQARQREEALKKALGVEKECIASMEKTLHEIRAESAEAKVAAENKLIEARSMKEEAEKKFSEALAKNQAAEALKIEASRFHRMAEKKLQEVEAREDDLMRRIQSFKSECEAKEREFSQERQSLSERQRILQQGQKSLLDGQALLNQREEYMLTKSQELNQLEKELEGLRADLEKQRKELNSRTSDLELRAVLSLQREEAVTKRESLLDKKEQELLILREKIASKELDDAEKAVADQETNLRLKKSEFEAELEKKYKLVEDELDARRRAWELKEMDLIQREDQLQEKEHDLEIKSKSLEEKERDLAEKLENLDLREKNLDAIENDIEVKNVFLKEEREKINKMKLDLQNSFDLLEERKKQVDDAKDKIETMKNEFDELSVLELKLKEELDSVRAQRLEVMAEVDRLKAEKGKFENEWESIDEKREELKSEANRVAEEKLAVKTFLKDESESLRVEKEAMRNQYKSDVEALRLEREEFMNNMERERSEWYGKIQQERADFLLEIEIQKKELENCIEKRREELEASLKEKEMAFEQEKKIELQHINSLKETAEKELERVAFEMKRLENERMKINLDREQREREWSELKGSIEELKLQQEKLKQQRELLHADREEIFNHIESLKKLDDLKIALDKMAVAGMQQSARESKQNKISGRRISNYEGASQNHDLDQERAKLAMDGGSGSGSPSKKEMMSELTPSSARFSWIRRCADMIFKSSSGKLPLTDLEKSVSPENGDAAVRLARRLDSSNGHQVKKHSQTERLDGSLTDGKLEKHGEERMIFEVPAAGDMVKTSHRLEPRMNVDSPEESKEANSEQAIHPTRKRRVPNSQSEKCSDISLKRRDNKKRRALQQDAAVDPLEAADNFINLGISHLEDDQGVSRSTHGTKVISEATTTLVIDKVAKTPRLSSKNIPSEDGDSLPNAAKVTSDRAPSGNGLLQFSQNVEGIAQGVVKHIQSDEVLDRGDTTNPIMVGGESPSSP